MTAESWLFLAALTVAKFPAYDPVADFEDKLRELLALGAPHAKA